MSRKTARLIVPLTAAGVSVLLMAAPASAAVTVGFSPTATDVLVASSASDSFSISCPAGALSVAGTTYLDCDQVTSLGVSLGTDDDRVDLRTVATNAFAAGAPVTIDGGLGADVLLGARGTITGGGGNDRIINPVSGTIDGGDGTDSVELDATDAPDVATDITIGATAFTRSGEAPVTVSNVESYALSTPDGVNNQSAVNSAAYAGRVVARLHGGIDSFNGGPGNDYVDAGPGTDSVNPGAGNDAVQGGEGQDTIYTLDGEVDTVDCGDGPDTVTADRGDVVKNCETVNLPPLPPPTPAPVPAPETSAVVGPKQLKRGVKASFAFVASTTSAGFECRVDSKAWRSCSSPFKVNTRKLGVGKHKLFVRATASGLTDATPSKYTFRVKPNKRR